MPINTQLSAPINAQNNAITNNISSNVTKNYNRYNAAYARQQYAMTNAQQFINKEKR